jgi:hypothetical protein
MEYYIVSLIISVVVFGIIYILDNGNGNGNGNGNDYDNGNDNGNGNDNDNGNDNGNGKKPLFSTNNILLFVIIYIVATIISYYIFTSSLSFASLSAIIPVFILNLFKPPQEAPPLINDNDEIDPKILRKINDNIDTGFMPVDVSTEPEEKMN